MVSGKRGNPPQQHKSSSQTKLVENQPGFTISLTVLFLSLFLGLAFRFVFSPSAIESRIKSEMTAQIDSEKIVFEGVSLSLADGSIPQFALRVSSISLDMENQCSLGFKLQLEKMNIPLSFWELLFGKLKLSSVVINNASLESYKSPCEGQNEQVVQEELAIPNIQEAADELPEKVVTVEVSDNPSKKTVDRSPATISIDKLIKTKVSEQVAQLKTQGFDKDLDRAFLEIGKAIKSLNQLPVEFSRIELRNFNFLLEGQAWTGSEFFVYNSPNSKSLNYSLFFDFPDSIGRGLSNYFKFKLSGQMSGSILDSKLSMIVNEGAASLGVVISKKGKSDFRVESKLDVDHFALSSLSQLLENFHANIFTELPDFAWLNCELSTGSNFDELEKLQINLNQCRLSGRRGEIRVPRVQWSLERGFVPFAMAFHKIDLSKVSAWLGQGRWKGVFENLGLLSGELNFKSFSMIDFEGQLRGLVARFSSRGVRRDQVFEKVGMQLTYDKERIAIKLKSFELKGGDIQGEISGNFNNKLDSGVIQVDLERVNFSQPIETLLLGGRLENLKVLGQARLKNSEIDRWRGMVKADSFLGSNFEFKNISAKTEFRKKVFQMNIKNAKGRLFGTLYEFFRPSLLDHPFKDNELIISSLSTNLQVGENKLAWKGARVFLPDKISVSSNGAWSADQAIEGRLFVNYPQLKQIKWIVSGTREVPVIEPDLVWLRRLAKANPKLELNSEIEKLQQLKSEDGQGSVIRGIGRKLIKRARAAVPKLLDFSSSDKEAVKSQDSTQKVPPTKSKPKSQ